MANSYPNEWHVPDWRDRPTYEGLASLTDTLWRWQFLRRHAEYRQDWKIHAQGTYERELSCYGGNVERVLPLDHPDFKADIVYLAVNHTRALEEVINFNEACERLDRYGLRGCGMPAPWIDRPSKIFFDETDGAVLEGTGDKIGPLRVSLGQAMYMFDLKKPIAQQIKKAAKKLIGIQRFRMRKKVDQRLHRELWPDYLRILDARAEGITFSKMGQTILRVKDYDAAASRAKKAHDIAAHLAFNFPS